MDNFVNNLFFSVDKLALIVDKMEKAQLGQSYSHFRPVPLWITLALLWKTIMAIYMFLLIFAKVIHISTMLINSIIFIYLITKPLSSTLPAPIFHFYFFACLYETFRLTNNTSYFPIRISVLCVYP